MEDKILIGSHVSLKSPKYFLGTVEEAISYEETTFMFYTGAPQNGIRVPLEKMKIDEGLKLLNENSIDIKNVVVHAPYIINLASPKEETFNSSKEILTNEIKRTEAFGCQFIVLHPGLHVGSGDGVGINRIIEGLNSVLDNLNTKVIVCLETMAGKGSELGKSFEEISKIIDGINKKSNIGVCMDTCHLNDSGYDVSNIDNLLNEFDKKVGLHYLKAVHLNDSKNLRGQRKDRHENIGYGTIGFDTLHKWVVNEKLKSIPKILETPWIDDKPPYKEEIKMLLNNKFDNSLK